MAALRAIDDVCGGDLAAQLRRCAGAVGKGSSLAASLRKQGLISELDHALVKVGEHSGHLPRVFEDLGARYLAVHGHWRKMKGRLMLPAFMLLVAIFALPVPALVAGRITPGRYLGTTLSMLALVFAVAMLLRGLLGHWRTHGPPTSVTRIARLLPLSGRLSRLHERAEVSGALALCLGAGIAASQALGLLLQVQQNGVRRENLVGARSVLDGGMSVANALRESGLLDRSGFATVSAGEHAGRLDQSLRHYARSANDTLDGLYDLLARWIPVIVYAGVAGVVAAGILG